METGVRHMLRNRIEADYAVFLTDTEECGSGWLAAWRECRRKYPKAVAFVRRGDSYMTSPIPECPFGFGFAECGYGCWLLKHLTHSTRASEGNLILMRQPYP